MTVTFFINYLNHHQVPVADEMYRLLGDDFRFVATFPRSTSELKGGEDYSGRPYCLLPAENIEHEKLAHRLNLTSDVCIYGAGNLCWEAERAVTKRLSFEISERWFKRGIINLLSPRLIEWWWLYQTKLRDKPFYKLCASAFTASDCRKLRTFKNRCFKWGYFTKLPVFQSKPINQIPQIMWCGRMIGLKHPEHAIEIAWRLKKLGYKFTLNIYGDGQLINDIKQTISRLSLDDCVILKGNVPNPQILSAMHASDILLFTSNRQEGWGAVVNEAMSAGCCIIGSDAIGSVPYLITDGVNGLIYRYGNLDSLFGKIKYALENMDKVRMMGQLAAIDISETWSPNKAANNLMQLIDCLNGGESQLPLLGPCSKA